MKQKLNNCPTCNKLSTLKSVTVNGERIKGCVKCLSKLKDSVLKEKRKLIREKKKLKKTEMLKLIQKLARCVGKNICCTCKRPFSKSLIANGGHGIRSSKGMSTALLLLNIHEQCSHCNSIGQGEQVKYAKFVDEKYGEGTFDFLERISNVECKISISDMADLRKKAEEFIYLAESCEENAFIEKDKLRMEFILWQENTDWYKEIIRKLQQVKNNL